MSRIAFLFLTIGLFAHAFEVEFEWSCSLTCREGSSAYSGVSVKTAGAAPERAEIEAVTGTYCSEEEGVKSYHCSFAGGTASHEDGDDDGAGEPARSDPESDFDRDRFPPGVIPPGALFPGGDDDERIQFPPDPCLYCALPVLPPMLPAPMWGI